MLPLATVDALRLVNQLTTMNNFPRQEAAIKATAEDLIELCVGATIDGRLWRPLDQAEWLVHELRHNQSKWISTSETLVATFKAKFAPPPPERRPYVMDTRCSIACGNCKDWGTVADRDGSYSWCSCSAADWLRNSMGDKWLELVNSHKMPKPKRVSTSSRITEYVEPDPGTQPDDREEVECVEELVYDGLQDRDD